MKPQYLIIHHTATSRDKTRFEAVKNDHIRRGWGNIGYHFFITADGILHEGRGQDQVGAQCRADGMNYKSLGICLAGNFEIEFPNKKQLETLKGIIGQLRKIWKIPVSNVLGHREVKGAAGVCPGKHLLIFVKTIREDDSKPSPEDQNELLETIKEQRQEIGRLKSNFNNLNYKYQKKLELIKDLETAWESNKSWVTKWFERIKKNDENT